MLTETIVTADGGLMGAFLAQPPSPHLSNPRPVVVLLQEIFGVNEAMRAAGREFAAAGYLVLVPDLFWRIAPGTELSYTAEGRKAAFDLLARLDRDLAVDDAAASIDHARRLPEANGSVAVVGFCLGGMLAVRAAPQTMPEAVAALYGVRLDDCVEDMRAYGGPVSLHFGENDDHIPAETVDRIATATSSLDTVHIHTYAGAGHGFFNPLRPDAFNPAAAHLAFERIKALLEHSFSGRPSDASRP